MNSKSIGSGIIAAVAILLIFASFFTVNQNEMAVVTRFGELRYIAGPGLHFKVPFVDATQPYRTDIVVVAPERGVNTYTVDNQEVDVNCGFR